MWKAEMMITKHQQLNRQKEFCERNHNSFHNMESTFDIFHYVESTI